MSGAFLPKGHCAVCEHSEIKTINQRVLSNVRHIDIVEEFGGFSRQTLIKHNKNCLKVSHQQVQQNQRINSLLDADAYYQKLTDKALEALEASREVLVVNGELNMNPREWEINVVFKHPFMKDEKGKPLICNAPLSEVIQMIEDNSNIKVKSYTLKHEDIRKTYRSALLTYKECLDTYLRIFGAFKQESDTTQEQQLDSIRATIKHVTTQMQQRGLNTDYRTQLESYILIYRSRLKRELIDELERELNSIPKNITPTPSGIAQKECLSIGDESPMNQESKTKQ